MSRKMTGEELGELIAAVDGSGCHSMEDMQKFSAEMEAISDLLGECPKFMRTLAMILQMAQEEVRAKYPYDQKEGVPLANKVGGSMFTIGFKAGRLSKEREDEQ